MDVVEVGRKSYAAYTSFVYSAGKRPLRFLKIRIFSGCRSVKRKQSELSRRPLAVPGEGRDRDQWVAGSRKAAARCV